MDSIAASPTVRLDMSGGTRGPFNMRDGTRFDPPPLKRSIPSSLMADGGMPTSAAYDNRTIILQLQPMSNGVFLPADQAATQLQLLLRELDRTTNVLRYSAGTTSPVFFRTYRSGPDSVTFDPNNKEVTVTLLAEPFAYGLEETLAAVTVYNDPAEGATLNLNPFFETNASDWTPVGGTFVRSTAQFHEGAASGLLTPDGVSASAETDTGLVVIPGPGTTVRASAWLRCAVARSVNLSVNWFTAAGVYLSTSNLAISVSANTWTLFDYTATAPATAFKASLVPSMSSTPAASNLLFVDEAKLRAGGLYLDIDAPKGDVETPLFMLTDAGVVGAGRRRSAFAVRRRGTVSATPLILQAEAMTLGSNVTLPGNDVAMSGPGSNYARISYSVDVNLVPRLATNTKFPTSGSVDARGTYRVYARIRQPSGTGATVHQMRIAWGGADVQVVNDTVTLPVDTGAGAPTVKMIDLGLVQIPFGFDPVDKGISGVEVATEGIYLRFDTGRVSGSGTTLDIDYLMFLPADDKVELIMWPGTASVNDFIVEGGPSPAVYARNASAQITSTEAVQIAGTGLMITPGRTNRIFFHRDVGTGTSVNGSGDSVTATTAIYPSYYPRYLGAFRPTAT